MKIDITIPPSAPRLKNPLSQNLCGFLFKNITLTSYIDRLDFGLVACKVAVPDMQDIADGILTEFKLLKKAVADAGLKPPAKKPVKTAAKK